MKHRRATKWHNYIDALAEVRQAEQHKEFRFSQLGRTEIYKLCRFTYHNYVKNMKHKQKQFRAEFGEELSPFDVMDRLKIRDNRPYVEIVWNCGMREYKDEVVVNEKLVDKYLKNPVTLVTAGDVWAIMTPNEIASYVSGAKHNALKEFQRNNNGESIYFDLGYNIEFGDNPALTIPILEGNDIVHEITLETLKKSAAARDIFTYYFPDSK